MFVTLNTNKKMKLGKISHIPLPFLILKTPETHYLFLICLAVTGTSVLKKWDGIFCCFWGFFF